MPVYLSTLVAIVLMLEIAYAVWSTFYINSQIVRNRQLMVDVITDLFCLIFPLAYMYYGARVPLEVSEVVYLVSPPTCFLLSKINDIWDDIFEIDLERIKGKNLTNTTRKSGRRRSSILNLTASKEQMEAQLKECFPYQGTRVKMPEIGKNTIKFKNYPQKLVSHYIMYADLEYKVIEDPNTGKNTP